MRVAMIAAGPEILGGHAVQVRALMEGLRADGCDADFLPINPRFPAALRGLRRVRYLRTAVNEVLFLNSLERLRRADVVHIFSAAYWSFVLFPVPAILAARVLGRRVVLHYHTGEAADHLGRWGLLVHPWLRLVDEIVVPSAYLREIFGGYGYAARVIPNVVDPRRFAYRERRPLRPALLSTRNLEPHYAVDNTLRAFARLRARCPGATLTVAGSGSEEPGLRALARSLGLADVRFIGRVEPEEMPAVCGEADIFVNSSVVDNQPLSVLEAFAAGLPVVSTPTGGIGTLVRDGETGLLVPQGDPEAMAAAVADLLADEARALRMARRARHEVEQYTWPHVRGAWAKVYAGRAGAVEAAAVS